MSSFKGVLNIVTYTLSLIRKNGLTYLVAKTWQFITDRGFFALLNVMKSLPSEASPSKAPGNTYNQSHYEHHNKHDPARAKIILNSNRNHKKLRNKALLFHIHYFDVFESFIQKYLEATQDFDLFCTVTPNISREQLSYIANKFPNVYFKDVENLGRDILPFLKVLNSGILNEYSYCLKLHTKKSIHLPDGLAWREELYLDLMNVSAFETRSQNIDDTVVMWSYTTHLKNIETSSSINYKRLSKLLGSSPKGVYVAGTMFWFRPSKLNRILPSSLLDVNFEPEPLPTDGSWAHVIERYIGAKIGKDGFKIVSVK